MEFLTLSGCRRFGLIFALILLVPMVISCSDNADSPVSRTELWGVFKTDDGTIVNTGGETSDFSVCNEGYRSTASDIELDLWTMVFLNNSVKVYNTTNNNLLAKGTVVEDMLFIDSIDGEWSFTADYRKAGCCFDGTDGTSSHWHGIRMPDYLDPSTIGQNHAIPTIRTGLTAGQASSMRKARWWIQRPAPWNTPSSAIPDRFWPSCTAAR
jgi:hypothetical protein